METDTGHRRCAYRSNPEHMQDNANVDFIISEQDMEALKNMKPLKDYGEFSAFPVFSGK